MFNMFKKKDAMDYDKKLITKFQSEHKKLVDITQKISLALKNSKNEEAKKHMRTLKTEIISHFMQEDIKLYWRLKKYYKEEPDILNTILEFEKSIKEIQRDVVKFLNKYTLSNALLDEEFQTKLSSIVYALAQRIHTEEQHLYTLYKK